MPHHVINLPDLSNHSQGELQQIGEDYLAYSDEQWHVCWEEGEEALRQRAFALAFRFMANRFFYSKPRLSQRYDRGSTRAQALAQHHWNISAEYRAVAQEAEISSKVVFEAAEERHVAT